MTEGWVDYLTGPWGFAFALAAGLLSFLSPCVLPLVPAYLAHLTGTTATMEPSATDRRATVTHAVSFVLGFTVIFTLVGASVGLLSAAFGDENGYFIRDHTDTLAKIGGVFLIVLGLNLIGVIRLPLLYRTYSLEFATAGGPATATVRGAGGASGGWISGLSYGKSFGVGATFAVAWTPCIGPVLGAIITLAAVSSSVGTGMWLLFVYSLGLGVPFILTSLAVVPVTRFLRRFRNALPVVEVAAGVLVIFVGVLIFLDEATIFNEWFSRIPFLEELNQI